MPIRMTSKLNESNSLAGKCLCVIIILNIRALWQRVEQLTWQIIDEAMRYSGLFSSKNLYSSLVSSLFTLCAVSEDVKHPQRYINLCWFNVGWIPLMYEGVEARENEQRHHGAQRHHVVKLWLQYVARVHVLHSFIFSPISRGVDGWVLQPVCEVLKNKMRFISSGRDVYSITCLWSIYSHIPILCIYYV